MRGKHIENCFVVFLGEFSSEDEGLNLSKYRKLTTEQKIKDFKKEDVASDTSSCKFF